MRGVLNFDGSEWSSASHNVRDLLGKMLLYTPEARITAKDALNHPWFKNYKKPVRKISSMVIY
jgi:serine/threonine protein kinase